MSPFGKTVFALVFASTALLAAPLKAGEFVVNPIRLDLDAQARTGVISVRNEGKEKLNFQLQGMEWTQDALGNDQYTESRDLIFFPRIMAVDPGEEGVVRIGARNLLVPLEKTFRLFIEELPGPATPSEEGKSARINVLIRFGAPIFVSPAKPDDSLDIGKAEMSKGVLTLSVKNTGNRHQVVQGIRLSGADEQGKEIYSLTLADRYLLAGTNKSYSVTIEPDQCARIAGITIELKTDKAEAKRKLSLSKAMCS